MPVQRVYDAKTPTTNDAIDRLEAKLRIKFPTPYRYWLLQYNGGRPWPGAFRYKHETGPYTDGGIAWFYSIHDGPHNNLEWEFIARKVHDRRLPDDLVPIACDGLGNEVCISVSGPDEGKVFFWDHEEEGLDEKGGPWRKNVHLLADSFDEFLDALFEPEPLSQELIDEAKRLAAEMETEENQS